MTRRHWAHVPGVLGLTLFSRVVSAQLMDYGALEQVFGESVTTSVTGAPQRASDVPANMEIITADEIRRSGARDIPGVLRHVIGVDFLQWADDNTDLSVRGYDQVFSQRLLVLINGRQVYADYYGFTPWSTLPVELGAIRQIELVKGPASALFGFNAVGGVINIITYNPRFDEVDTLSLGGGTQGLAQGSAVTTFKPSDGAALRISAGGRSDEDYSTPIPAALAGSERRHNNRGAIDLDGVIQMAEAVQLRIEASHTKAATFDLSPGYVFEFSRFTTNSVKGEIAADTRWGLVQANAYVNTIEQKTPPGLFGVDFKNRMSFVQLQDVFKSGTDHTLRAALEYRRDSTNTSPLGGADIKYDVLSASAMWEWKMTRSLSLTNAVRFDRLSLSRSGATPAGFPYGNSYWDRTLDESSFNSGLVWQAGDADTLRLTSSRGVLLPNMARFGAFVAVTPFINFNGNPRLDPTIVTNQELDWNHSFPALRLKVRAAAFHQNTTDVVSLQGGFVPSATALYLTPSNIGNSDAHGIELGIRSTRTRHLHWTLNYRFERIRDRFVPSAQGGAQFIDYEHTTPAHLINLNVGWAGEKWEIDGYAHYQSSSQGLVLIADRSVTTLTALTQYTAVDARIAYKLDSSWTLSLSGQNLLQSPQRQTAAADVERQVLATVTVNF